jgi:hypothetical protein
MANSGAIFIAASVELNLTYGHDVSRYYRGARVARLNDILADCSEWIRRWARRVDWERDLPWWEYLSDDWKVITHL